MIFPRFKNQLAITLTELIVSTIVIGIIMAGIVSMDAALQVSAQGTSRNALVAMRTSAIMQHIIKNTQLAKGDLNGGGIDIKLLPLAVTISIRQEDPYNLNPTLLTESWTTYTFSQDNHQIFVCTSAAKLPGVCSSLTGGTSLGTLSTLTASLNVDPITQEFYLEVVLINRFDLNTAANPFENPEITLMTRINPLSWSSN